MTILISLLHTFRLLILLFANVSCARVKLNEQVRVDIQRASKLSAWPLYIKLLRLVSEHRICLMKSVGRKLI